MKKEVVRAKTSYPASREHPIIEQPPPISRRLLKFFGGYAESYLRRHFHTARLLANSAPVNDTDLPLVIYLNHSSWWDPLVCLLLARKFFPRRDCYAPIDAAALRRYRFFRRLGFFGVESSPAGVKTFLETATAILRSEKSALWITPQGKFADFHARPVRLERGLSHLTRHVTRAAFISLAIQYVYWEERLPEILIAFGDPVVFEASQALGAADTTHLFESALTSVQDHLAKASARRRTEDWRPIVEGRAGVNVFYDAWRKARAIFRGEKFNSAHSKL